MQKKEEGRKEGRKIESTEVTAQDLDGTCGIGKFKNKHKIITANICIPSNAKINWFDKIDYLLNNFSSNKLDFTNGDLNYDL